MKSAWRVQGQRSAAKLHPRRVFAEGADQRFDGCIGLGNSWKVSEQVLRECVTEERHPCAW